MEDIEKILEDSKQLIENCKNLQAELEAMDEGKEFLLNKYKTNKHWFRDEPGRVTIENVIKRAFEFGWSAKSNFDYSKK